MPKTQTAPQTPPKPPGAVATYLHVTRSPMTAAALTLPLLTFYGLGSILFKDTRNGVDLISTTLAWSFAAMGARGWRPYALFYGTLLLGNLGLIYYLKSKSQFNPRTFIPLLIECGIYAVATGTISSTLTHNLLHAIQPWYSLSIPTSQLSAAVSVGASVSASTLALPALSTGGGIGPISGLFISAGAGLHEELVFRLVGIGGVARAWLGKGWRTPTLKLLAVVFISSVVFSGAHHIVEPFQLQVFVFRIFAGLVFASLYLVRGFAVAAWTHALYDVWVIVVLNN